jgi:hypothetical protein
MSRLRPRRSLVRPAVLCLAAALAPGGVSRPVVAEPDAATQKAINAAIARGRAWLRAQRGSDGLFEPLVVHAKDAYQIGVSSLCGMALLASGESKREPGMLKTLDALRKEDAKLAQTSSRRTYDTGALLMFLTELHRPEAKPGERYAKPKTKDPCGIPKDLFAWMQELASWLVSVQLPEGWWRYPQFPPGDLSNAQYALLGLRAARDCGASVPLEVFLKTLRFTLENQEKDGPKVRRIVKGSGKPGESDYAVDSGDRARGWGYQPGLGPTGVTGSMTTAAIAVLAIARDALSRPEKYGGYDDATERAAARAVQDGFAWLDKHWAVDRNPPAGAPAWHYYYLYGLERACAYAGREAVGLHDWYVEGAQHLVGAQKADGRWSTGSLGTDEILASDLCDTAWALLFLKKATRPTAPIPAPVVTPGG